MKMHRRILFIVISVLIILFFVGFWIAFEHGGCIDTVSLIINKVAVSRDIVEISGDTLASASAFVGFDYRVKNNNLYIRPRYSIVTKNHPFGHFDIKIKDKFSNLEVIYLKGCRDTKLVWHK